MSIMASDDATKVDIGYCQCCSWFGGGDTCDSGGIGGGSGVMNDVAIIIKKHISG